MNFDLHGLFKFKIEGTDKRLLKYFSQDYAYFKTNEEIESELDIIVSDFTPSTDDCRIVDHKYYVKKNYLFWKDRHKIVRWSLSIQDIENKPRVYFKGGLFSGIFLRENIIEPLIGFKLAQKGFSLLHASGVAIDNKGFIFAGSPGAGKTAMILNLTDRNTFLCDEVAILSSDGVIHGIPSPIHVYKYNLENVPGVSGKITPMDKFEVKMKFLAYRLSFKYAKLPLSLKPGKLFSKIGGAYPVHCLALLTRTNSDRVKIVGDIDKEELVEQLTLINKYQFHRFAEFISAYSYGSPKSEASLYWQTSRDILLNALRKVSCYEIKTPLRYDWSTHEEIGKVLKEIGAFPGE